MLNAVATAYSTPAGTNHVTLKHGCNKTRKVAVKTNFGIPLLKPSSLGMLTKEVSYLLGGSLKDGLSYDGNNEIVMAAYSTQSVPKLYSTVGLCKKMLRIALPPPVPLYPCQT